jgi:hypothetical protein
MIAGYMPISARQRLRHSGGWQTFGIVVLMLAVASIPLTVAYGALADHQALKVEWAIDGPACPVVFQTVRYHRPPQAFSYRGVRFTASMAMYSARSCPMTASCRARTTRPASSAHRRPSGSRPPAAAFSTSRGIGRAATVTIRDGRPSCVIGGWFR